MSNGGNLAGQHIENLGPEAWTPEVEALFPIMLPPGSSAKGSDFNSILLLAHHPRLSEPWLQFNAKIAQGFTLSAREREIAILRVAWRRGSEYEWVHHMLSGARAGLTIAHFSSLQSEEAFGDWSELEALLIRATDEICLDGGVEPDTLTKLRDHLSTEQVMELLYGVGCYIALAAILNTAGVAIEPSITEMAASAGFPNFSPPTKAKDSAR